jgi:Asp-tRNA(Asn)/Glu-tRNA(Gln) amidotransferase A subunit family amidase
MAIEGVRSAIWADLVRQFETFDCLVTPTMATLPPPATDDDASHYHLLPDHPGQKRTWPPDMDMRCAACVNSRRAPAQIAIR